MLQLRTICERHAAFCGRHLAKRLKNRQISHRVNDGRQQDMNWYPFVLFDAGKNFVFNNKTVFFSPTKRVGWDVDSFNIHNTIDFSIVLTLVMRNRFTCEIFN